MVCIAIHISWIYIVMDNYTTLFPFINNLSWPPFQINHCLHSKGGEMPQPPVQFLVLAHTFLLDCLHVFFSSTGPWARCPWPSLFIKNISNWPNVSHCNVPADSSWRVPELKAEQMLGRQQLCYEWWRCFPDIPIFVQLDDSGDHTYILSHHLCVQVPRYPVQLGVCLQFWSFLFCFVLADWNSLGHPLHTSESHICSPFLKWS